eukprot:GFUD01133219.1.p1 GENE.GFUD01133219.1~~GFUD01133219.1.p1  ORF type:complete len:146 (+),score=35.60 GFUD01133219.1:34-438(+)
MLLSNQDLQPPVICSAPLYLQGQPLPSANFSECVKIQSEGDFVSTSSEKKVMVISISVSMVLLLTAVGVMVFHNQVKGCKLVRSIQETVCRRKEAGQGMKYQRSFVHQDTDYFVSFGRNQGEQMNGRIVPVTEL